MLGWARLLAGAFAEQICYAVVAEDMGYGTKRKSISSASTLVGYV